ncbi:transcriptional coactivator p15/PC4 family protein [Aestuariivirga sp.]|uniref:transcriptional coactivator p15/PC4 family protein n=1 Tax=Aestuariivirga sp. TaxID=2650926 RepID=UPI0039E30FE6
MAQTFIIQKNSREEVRISRESYRGHELVNVRTWYRADDDGTMKPGKQGLAVKAEKLPELIAALQQLESEGG